MKKTAIIIVLIFLSFKVGFACLNGDSKVLKDGTYLYTDFEGKVPAGHQLMNEERAKALIDKLDNLFDETLDLDYLSDKGVVLIFLKRYDEALKLYLQIETRQPNRYSTASNIGTLYELIGDNQNALKWIKKAISIDPKSHDGSEWIHVKILEAKINGEKYITSQQLLNTNFGTDSIPVTKLKKSALNNLSTALFYQLNERMTFIKPREKIMALLLFDLGNIAFLEGRYEDAKEDYLLAKQYGFNNDIIEKRLISNKKWHASGAAKHNEGFVNNSVFSKKQAKQIIPTERHIFSWPVVAGLILIVAIVILILRLKNKKAY